MCARDTGRVWVGHPNTHTHTLTPTCSVYRWFLVRKRWKNRQGFVQSIRIFQLLINYVGPTRAPSGTGSKPLLISHLARIVNIMRHPHIHTVPFCACILTDAYMRSVWGGQRQRATQTDRSRRDEFSIRPHVPNNNYNKHDTHNIGKCKIQHIY